MTSVSCCHIGVWHWPLWWRFPRSVVIQSVGRTSWYLCYSSATFECVCISDLQKWKERDSCCEWSQLWSSYKPGTGRLQYFIPNLNQYLFALPSFQEPQLDEHAEIKWLCKSVFCGWFRTKLLNHWLPQNPLLIMFILASELCLSCVHYVINITYVTLFVSNKVVSKPLYICCHFKLLNVRTEKKFNFINWFSLLFILSYYNS